MENLEFNTSLLSFKIDEIFSKFIQPRRPGANYLENSISDYTSDSVYEFLSNFNQTIYGNFGSETIYFRWIFNRDKLLQQNLGDISVLISWEEKKQTRYGGASLEAKVTVRKDDITARNLDEDEIKKIESHETSIIPVKYLIYSAEKFEDAEFESLCIPVRAKCVPIKKMKEVKFSLNPIHYKRKDEFCFSVGNQIVERYLNKKDIYIYPLEPNNPDPDIKNIAKKFKELNQSQEGSILLISKCKTNLISNFDFGISNPFEVHFSLVPRKANNQNTMSADF